MQGCSQSYSQTGALQSRYCIAVCYTEGVATHTGTSKPAGHGNNGAAATTERRADEGLDLERALEIVAKHYKRKAVGICPDLLITYMSEIHFRLTSRLLKRQILLLTTSMAITYTYRPAIKFV